MASGDHSEQTTNGLVDMSIPELFAQAQADHEAGRLQPALEAYARILDRDGGHAATLLYVADIYLKYDRVADARLLLEHLLKLDEAAFQDGGGGLPDTCVDFARAWGGEQRQLVDRILARAVEAWPDLPKVNEAVAMRLAEYGDLKQAEAYFKHALRLAPDRSGTWYQLALVRITAEDLAGALEALLEVLDIDPGHTEAVRRTIAVVENLEDPELAAYFLQRLIELIDEDGEALAYIGFKLLASRHFDGALTAFARAADLDLRSYETLIGATTAAHALGEDAGVKAYWEQAMASMPAEGNVWLAMAQTFGPDLPEALTRQLIDGAATILCGRAAALCDVVELAVQLGQAETAKTTLALALAAEPGNRRARDLEAILARERA